jgi:DNA-binding CsgD family transcriptional regulator
MHERLFPIIDSLFEKLGPNPSENIHTIVSKAADLLNCGGAFYGCLQPDTNETRIRSTHNIPEGQPSPLNDLCRQILACAGAEPFCMLNPAAEKGELENSPYPTWHFHSVIGHVVPSACGSPGVVAAVDSRPREFSPTERLIIALLAKSLALEEAHLHREEMLEGAVNEKTTAMRRANERLKTEIKGHKNTIGQLTEREAELREKSKAFDELNTTLSVLLKKRDSDIIDLEERMIRNIRELIDPALSRLIGSALKPAQLKWLKLIDSSLNELASPFASKISSGYHKLTPMEIKVASFIKQGKTNKEISEFLGISPRTVEVHRNNIRHKFGIQKRKLNLRSHLMSID